MRLRFVAFLAAMVGAEKAKPRQHWTCLGVSKWRTFEHSFS